MKRAEPVYTEKSCIDRKREKMPVYTEESLYRPEKGGQMLEMHLASCCV